MSYQISFMKLFLLELARADSLLQSRTLANGKQPHSTGRSAQGDHLEGWDREGGRETQEGGDMGIYVYI